MAVALGRRAGADAALFWRWFGYWRKRYMWLRLAIIIVVFAEPVYGVFHPLIRDLVVMAIKGIETAKRGPRSYADYYQFVEKKQLQKRLLARFDANRNGRLERAEAVRLRKETGLSAGQVTGKGLRVGLDPLLEANHKLGLVPRDVTGKVLRRKALDQALADGEREHQTLWQEIEPDLAMQYPGWRDYLKWGTWVRGLESFRGHLGYSLGTDVGDFFVGIGPSSEEYAARSSPGPLWRGLIGWLLLLLALGLSVLRYGKGEALRKRFDEDPEFALAPCPVCGTPTHDYGALPQLRWARAWATAAVVGIPLVALNALARSSAVSDTAFGTGLLSRFAQPAETLVAVTVVAAVLRWLLWPREVHACHGRQWLAAVGYGVSVVLVAGLLGGVMLFVAQRWA